MTGNQGERAARDQDAAIPMRGSIPIANSRAAVILRLTGAALDAKVATIAKGRFGPEQTLRRSASQ